MVDTEKMRGLLARLTAGEQLTAREIGTFMDAADEIDAGRNARLVQYRCATASGLLADPNVNGNHQTLANRIEAFAHAMLAAERTPEVKP